METKTTKHISLTCLSFSVQYIFVVLPLKTICPIVPLEKINYFLNTYFLLKSWSKRSIERKRKRKKKEEKGKSISFIYSWVKLSFSLKSFYILIQKDVLYRFSYVPLTRATWLRNIVTGGFITKKVEGEKPLSYSNLILNLRVKLVNGKSWTMLKIKRANGHEY